MKGLAMEDGNAGSMGYELQRLRRGVRMAQLMSLVLGLLVLALLIALAAVGASQAKKIDNLKADNDGVFFGVHSRLKEARGATYAGSLFRGSGFWATRAVLPGTYLATLNCLVTHPDLLAAVAIGLLCFDTFTVGVCVEAFLALVDRDTLERHASVVASGTLSINQCDFLPNLRVQDTIFLSCMESCVVKIALQFLRSRLIDSYPPPFPCKTKLSSL